MPSNLNVILNSNPKKVKGKSPCFVIVADQEKIKNLEIIESISVKAPFGFCRHGPLAYWPFHSENAWCVHQVLNFWLSPARSTMRVLMQEKSSCLHQLAVHLHRKA